MNVTTRAHDLRAISLGGLAAGALDISAAFIVYGLRGISPVRILQSIAAGLLGRAAFSGGAPVAALGAALHFFIAVCAAAVYYAGSRRLSVLVQRPVACGMLYGVAVYFVMNYVVLPLSATGRPRFVLPMFITGIVIHMFCVGLPIALAVRRYSD